MTGKRKQHFLSENALLAAEWHPSKNGDVSPADIALHSNKRFWWLCSKCGHEWQTSANHRTSQGNGCPECAKIARGAERAKTAARKNNFAAQYPDLAAEWNYALNGSLSPEDVSASSNQKVWWQCSFCGHQWQNTVTHRTNRGSGCPACTRGQTSFAEQVVFFYVSQVFPDAVNRYKDTFEFDIFIPSVNTAVEYDGSFYHSSKKKLELDNSKDRYCHKQGIKLIRFRAPQLPDTENAIRITCQEHQLADGLVALFKILERTCSPIDFDKDHIKITEKFRQTQRENSLQTLYPHIAAEWHPTKNGKVVPSAIAPKANTKFWWKCSTCGYEWQSTPSHRSSRGDGCPFCSGKVVISGVNDLETLCPHIASEWNTEKNHPLSPSQVAKHSNKRVWWRCHLGHEWVTGISDRVIDQTQCPYCQNKKVLAGFNDLATTHPALAKEWNHERNALLPTEVTSGSKQKVWWKCQHGHEWESVIYSRKRGGCPYCSGKKVSVGFNDLAFKNPSLAKEWHPTKNGDLTPTDVTLYCNKYAWWLCSKCGHEWSASINSRGYGTGCPVCAGRHPK